MNRRLFVVSTLTALAVSLTPGAAGLTPAAAGLTPAAAGLTPAAAAPTAPAATDHAAGPIVIGHRGASGYRPDHTLAAYRLAIQLGADYVEPDLVATKDHILVARHENEISGTTDVADRSEFAARRTTKSIDGNPVTGWFTEDFTLAELRTLRAKERLPLIRQHNTLYDGLYQVPTLQEIIHLVRHESRVRNRSIGIYPETKHPTYFSGIGLPLEEPLVEILQKNGLNTRSAKVYIQSFETANLRRLTSMTRVGLVQLIDATGAPYDFKVGGDPRTYSDLVTPDELAWIARYARGIGVNTARIIPLDANGNTGEPTSLVADAHARRLIVHAWTLRNENNFLPANFRRGGNPAEYGDALGWYRLIFAQRVDGAFSDNPDTALIAAGRA